MTQDTARGEMFGQTSKRNVGGKRGDCLWVGKGSVRAAKNRGDGVKQRCE